jgi:DNA repair photolyase
MPLQKAYGNMYNWITHMWNAVLGECPNQCKYCYVKRTFWLQNNPMYKGEQHFNAKDEALDLGSGKIIFVAHTNDLFTADDNIIIKVLRRCLFHPYNQYIFQTKNPEAVIKYAFLIPATSFVGTTIESDVDHKGISKAPSPQDRAKYIKLLKECHGLKTFITVEPIMDFTPDFADLIIDADPDWVNIGADSKKSDLPEPSPEKIQDFISMLKKAGIETKTKDNLERLLGR